MSFSLDISINNATNISLLTETIIHNIVRKVAHQQSPQGHPYFKSWQWLEIAET